jgi:hypothetical protein
VKEQKKLLLIKKGQFRSLIQIQAYKQNYIKKFFLGLNKKGKVD